jgi:hypothetical protein
MYTQFAKLILALTFAFNLSATQKVDSKTAVLAVMEKYLFTHAKEIKNVQDLFTPEYIGQMGGTQKLQQLILTKKMYKKDDLQLEFIPSVTGDLFLVKVQDLQKHSILYRVRYLNDRYLIDGGQEDTQ